MQAFRNYVTLAHAQGCSLALYDYQLNVGIKELLRGYPGRQEEDIKIFLYF
jgi:hypothetical protein